MNGKQYSELIDVNESLTDVLAQWPEEYKPEVLEQLKKINADLEEEMEKYEEENEDDE